MRYYHRLGRDGAVSVSAVLVGFAYVCGGFLFTRGFWRAVSRFLHAVGRLAVWLSTPKGLPR